MFSFEIHKEQLLLLEKVLKQDGFRFIIIGQNHRDVHDHLKNWIKEKFPKQKVTTIEIAGKDYRSLMDAMTDNQNDWILIPDFDDLFNLQNEQMCTAINQRRDFFARNNMVLVCFFFEQNIKLMPEKIPDLWSLRTLEISLEAIVPKMILGDLWMQPGFETSSLGGRTLKEKEKEVENLLSQIKRTNPLDLILLGGLYRQLALIYFDFTDYQGAIENLMKALEIATKTDDEETQMTDLNRMGRIYYIIGDYDRATEFLNRALTLSRKIGDKNTEAAILNNIGQIFKNIADYDKAIDYIEKAIEIYNDTGFIKGLIVSKSSQAAIFYQYGKYHHSLKLWEECLPIAEEHNKELIGYLLNNISQVYRVLGNKNKALSLLEVSLAMQEELGDEEGMATTLNNIAAIYYVDGDVKKARKFFGKSLAFRQKSGSKAAFAAALSNLGQVYSSKKNYHLASKLLTQSLKLNRKIGDFTGLIPTLHNLSLIALEQKDMNKYFEQHEEAWRIASQIKDTTGIVNVGRILGPNLIEAGKVDEGLQILKTVYAVSKQSNLPNTEEIEHLIKKYED